MNLLKPNNPAALSEIDLRDIYSAQKQSETFKYGMKTGLEFTGA